MSVNSNAWESLNSGYVPLHARDSMEVTHIIAALSQSTHCVQELLYLMASLDCSLQTFGSVQHIATRDRPGTTLSSRGMVFICKHKNADRPFESLLHRLRDAQ